MKEQNFKMDLAKLIQKRLKEQGYDSFIGGSYRFGYSDEYSDVDIFVNTLNSYPDDLVNELFNGVLTHNYETKKSYGYGGTQYCNGNNIHVTFYPEKVYNCVKKEHTIVERFLNKNKILRKMRPLAEKGSVFYKHILALALDDYTANEGKDALLKLKTMGISVGERGAIEIISEPLEKELIKLVTQSDNKIRDIKSLRETFHRVTKQNKYGISLAVAKNIIEKYFVY